uniref:Putative inactive receptor kinase n=1 Tax=Aegilops tauschii TaxID=37682 RepID=N1QZC2_AEGTA
MENGSYVAVKRLREKIAKSQKEFEAEVNALGKIRHPPNLLALRAYYIHGAQSPVDWSTRMNIAMGVETDANMVHGNLTSNNILLDEGNNAKIADCGLSRLMSATTNSSTA